MLEVAEPFDDDLPYDPLGFGGHGLRLLVRATCCPWCGMALDNDWGERPRRRVLCLCLYCVGVLLVDRDDRVSRAPLWRRALAHCSPGFRQLRHLVKDFHNNANRYRRAAPDQ